MRNIIKRIINAWDALYPVERRALADKLAMKTFGQALMASPIGIVFGAWASGAVEHQEIGTRAVLATAATSLSIALMAAAKSWLRNAKVPDVLNLEVKSKRRTRKPRVAAKPLNKGGPV